MRESITAIVLTMALAAAAAAAAQGAAEDPAQVVGAPRGPRLEGAVLEARAKEIAGLLRCPVCQGLSVGDSPSTMASNMRAQVKDLAAAGYDQEQILAYFERSYGEFVRLKPPLRGVNWLVWLAPAFGLLAGAGVIAWALRAPRRAADAAPAAGTAIPGPGTLPGDPALARYVLRVRERAYGWPDGIAPEADAPSAAPEPAAGRRA